MHIYTRILLISVLFCLKISCLAQREYRYEIFSDKLGLNYTANTTEIEDSLLIRNEYTGVYKYFSKSSKYIQTFINLFENTVSSDDAKQGEINFLLLEKIEANEHDIKTKKKYISTDQIKNSKKIKCVLRFLNRKLPNPSYKAEMLDSKNYYLNTIQQDFLIKKIKIDNGNRISLTIKNISDRKLNFCNTVNTNYYCKYKIQGDKKSFFIENRNRIPYPLGNIHPDFNQCDLHILPNESLIIYDHLKYDNIFFFNGDIQIISRQIEKDCKVDNEQDVFSNEFKKCTKDFYSNSFSLRIKETRKRKVLKF